MTTSKYLGLVLTIALGWSVAASAQTYGASYVSAITYTNYGRETADVTMTFFGEGSDAGVTHSFTVPALGSSSLNVGSLSSISAGFKGSVVIDSDQPIVASVVQLPPSSIASKTRPLAQAFYEGKARLVLPRANKAQFNTTTIFSVQNADTAPNDVTVVFRNAAGMIVHTAAVANLPAGAAKFFDLGQIVEIATPFGGWVDLQSVRTGSTTPGRLVAVGVDFGTNSGSKFATAFEAVEPFAGKTYAPSAMCNFGAAQTNSSHAIVNSSSQAAMVSVLFSGSGVTWTASVPAFGRAVVAPCSAGNATGWSGSATITSDQPIAVANAITGGGVSDTTIGASSGSDVLVAPYVRWAADAAYNVNGGTQRTFITIQNLGADPVPASSITVRYYDAVGTVVETHTVAAALAAGAKATSNANSNHPNNTTFSFGFSPSGGSAIIEGPAGSKLAATVRLSSFVTYSTELAAEGYVAMRPPPLGGNTKDYCKPSPCLNGGTCSNDVSTFICTCAAGFAGSTCEATATNHCASNPCLNNGLCQNVGSAHVCVCADGFSGANCENTVDDCSPNPCSNGGTCTDGINTFTCTCASGFVGSTCDEVDPCAAGPCQNGGTCSAAQGSFVCSCATGFNGATCGTNINDCAASPCLNGGTCIDGVASFTCACTGGFSGPTCAVAPNPCALSPCQNGGTCVAAGSNFSCTCAPGFSGPACGTNINECASNPCLNGGTCTDGIASFTCSCAPGFNGATCSNNINDCNPNPCLNGGLCTDGVNSFTCACTGGFTGATCNVPNPCLAMPCQNGGMCAPDGGAFTCNCATGFDGPTCGNNIDDCAPAPCLNGGACTDGVSSFTCACTSNFIGPVCETALLSANFGSITGTDSPAFGGVGTVRGLEFAVSSPLSVTSIRVDELPSDAGVTTLLWHKPGAVDLQATNTFPLGTPIAPSTATGATATFTFAPPLLLTPGTHSLVLMVDDQASPGPEWVLRELTNTGQALTVGSTTFGNVWGWYGNVDMSNQASSVSMYDPAYFRIPKFVVTFAP